MAPFYLSHKITCTSHLWEEGILLLAVVVAAPIANYALLQFFFTKLEEDKVYQTQDIRTKIRISLKTGITHKCDTSVLLTLLLLVPGAFL
jgi:hypothetical protein